MLSCIFAVVLVLVLLIDAGVFILGESFKVLPSLGPVPRWALSV